MTDITTDTTPSDVASVADAQLLHRLCAVVPRPGTVEEAIGTMLDIVVQWCGAIGAEVEIAEGRQLTVSSGSTTDSPDHIEAPLHFGLSLIGMFRLHGTTDQVMRWAEAGFATLSVVMSSLVVAHLNHGTAAVAGTSRDHLLASVSHELRTPLTSISGLVSELLDDTGLDVTERARMLAMISEQSSDMARIVEDLLAGARARIDPIELRMGRIDPSAEAIKVAETAGIELAAAPETGIIFCEGDERRVRQILRNLLTNADRYGGPHITVSTFRDLRRAYVAVCDDGPPIPIEQRRILFEDFSSVEGVRRHPASIGIGLAVSRRLASMMGGSLGYEHDGRQSRFILGLPVESPSSDV